MTLAAKPRDDGRFKPGPEPRRTGRPKGSRNHIPPELVRALVRVATLVGYDGNGAGGFEGYVRYLQEEFPDLGIPADVQLPPPRRPPGRLNGSSQQVMS